MFLCLHMAWAESEENIRYNLNEADKTATVASGKDSFMHNSILFKGDIVIPETITVGGVTYTVTGLEDYCFATSSELTSITIPNTVTTLEPYCFYFCKSLSSITLPESVTSVGYYCFGFSGLTSITLSNNLTSLEEFCFYLCPLTSITIPNSVTSIGDDCFCGCESLTSVSIPNSVTSLGELCFRSCKSLTSITLPSSVTSLGDACFSVCDKLTTITMLSAEPPSTGYNLFGDTPLQTVYVVSEDAKNIYQGVEPWSAYDIVVLPTGIDNAVVGTNAPSMAGYYDLSGKPLTGKPNFGPAIVRYTNGTSRKVMVK